MKKYNIELTFEDITEEEHKKVMKTYFEIFTQTKGKCWSNTKLIK